MWVIKWQIIYKISLYIVCMKTQLYFMYLWVQFLWEMKLSLGKKINVKMKKWGQALIQSDWRPHKKRQFGHSETLDWTHTEERAREDTVWQPAVCPREAAEEPNLANTLPIISLAFRQIRKLQCQSYLNVHFRGRTAYPLIVPYLELGLRLGYGGKFLKVPPICKPLKKFL